MQSYGDRLMNLSGTDILEVVFIFGTGIEAFSHLEELNNALSIYSRVNKVM